MVNAVEQPASVLGQFFAGARAMSTVTHLEQFRGLSLMFADRPNHKSSDEGAELRELWSDSLATVAVVVLASVVVFEMLRVLMW
jgi:hypothetical protein